jgi:hypothetical protein
MRKDYLRLFSLCISLSTLNPVDLRNILRIYAPKVLDGLSNY